MKFTKQHLLRAASIIFPTVACSTAAYWLGIGPLAKAGLKNRLNLMVLGGTNVGQFVSPADSISEFDSRAVSQIAEYPACLEEECMPSELDRTSLVFQRNVEQLKKELCSIDGFFKKFKPFVSLIAQGYEPQSALIRHVSLQRNVPILAVENTAIKDRMIWDCVSGITTNRSLAKSFFWRYENSVDPDYCQKYCDHMIKTTRSRKLKEHQSPDAKLALPFKNYALFLGQVYTDTATLFSIDQWGKPENLLKTFLRICKKESVAAVIKLHPREREGRAPIVERPYDKLTWRKIQEDPELFEMCCDSGCVYVDHENEFDTYSLMEHCLLTTTLTSQSGLESAIRGKPSVVCGPAFYAGLGFTYDCLEPEGFEVAFARALKSEGTARTELARLFATIYFEKYCREKNTTTVFELLRLVGNSRSLF